VNMFTDDVRLSEHNAGTRSIESTTSQETQMIRSKLLPITLAALCGLAFQLQANAANAQAQANAAQPQSQANAANAHVVTLLPGNHLSPGMGLRTDNGHLLLLQADGNVVLYNSKHVVIWSTNTKGYEPLQFIMKGDGNLVLYATIGQVWASNTSGNPGAFLALQDDGNLVIHRSGSQTATPYNALWTSGTSGR
jgi:hypothetical protein